MNKIGLEYSQCQIVVMVVCERLLCDFVELIIYLPYEMIEIALLLNIISINTENFILYAKLGDPGPYVCLIK